jgi:DNA-binding LacI/PurR family transcriptional regulator
MAGIRDVAERAGVSIATVSRVLNRDPRVKDHLRERVLKAVAELNYRPSGIARNMRRQSTQVIGLIISDIQNPFFTALVRAVEDVAYSNQFTVILCNSDEDPQKEQLYAEVLIQERVSGVIIVPTGRDACDLLLKERVPLVLVDRRLPGVMADSVTLDNIAGAYAATYHLLQLGHTRIGLVGAPLHVSVGIERRLGYERALAEAGLTVDESLIHIGDFKETGGYRATRALLSLNPPPTAIFAVNNLMTTGALQAISEGGLRIPGDVSVVAFDDMPWLPLLTPPLTAVRQPVYEIGRTAAELLFQRMSLGPGGPIREVVLQPEFVIRGSTAPPRQ